MDRYKAPLRYPGGKQKLAPFLLDVMHSNGLSGCEYVEAYAGGAGIAVELLLTHNASRIHLNDSCERVHAFWRAILDDTERFCRKISSVPLTIQEWLRQRAILKDRSSEGFDLGFSAFFLNRCNRSGILGGGAIGGLKQNGFWKLDARFPRAELIRRIQAIAERKRDIRIRNWDGERFIKEYIPRLPNGTLIYLDPPYFNKADRLYLNHYRPGDHERIAELIQRAIRHPWLVSYDAVPSIFRFYRHRKSLRYKLHYNAANAYTGEEVFFFSDALRVPVAPTIQLS